jgi:hypothetical protein
MGPSHERELAAIVVLGLLALVVNRVFLWLMETTRAAEMEKAISNALKGEK